MKQTFVVLICVFAFTSLEINAYQELSSVRVKRAVKEVSCNFKTVESIYLNRDVRTCAVSGAIDSGEFVIAAYPDTTVDQIDFRRNKQVKFLPKNTGEKFPNLKELWARNCGLKTVHDYYFKNMKNLIYFNLNRNKISSIQPDAFNDLISVERIYLEHNLIETLDGNLFATTVNLMALHLNDNKINFLNPTTFKISGGKLREVFLESNACINASYYLSSNLNQLEGDLNANCTRK